jgi:quinol monooxygenase YgiN
MQGQTVTITVSLKAKPEFVDHLQKILTDLIVPSRREPGCLAYDILQSADDPQRFLL